MDGFWHVQVDEENSHLTTFETPLGRGISFAQEEFQRRLKEALKSVNGVKAVHGDALTSVRVT